jgi:putative acetyltransferase
MLEIRTAKSKDVADVHEVNALAFPTETEANLVDLLRENVRSAISLVAVRDGRIIGHILFTPVRLSGHSSLKIMGLAPMAVMPEYQRRGIGSRLVDEGLIRCRETGAGAVVVLGHPSYYPRFGFTPAAPRNIFCEYDVPADVFMVLELTADYLLGVEGTIRYHEAFGEIA